MNGSWHFDQITDINVSVCSTQFILLEQFNECLCTLYPRSSRFSFWSSMFNKFHIQLEDCYLNIFVFFSIFFVSLLLNFIVFIATSNCCLHKFLHQPQIFLEHKLNLQSKTRRWDLAWRRNQEKVVLYNGWTRWKWLPGYQEEFHRNFERRRVSD